MGEVVEVALAVLRDLVAGELDLFDDREKVSDVGDELLRAGAARRRFTGDDQELFEELGGDLAGEEVCNSHVLERGAVTTLDEK